MSRNIELSGVACRWHEPFFTGDDELASEFASGAFDAFLQSPAAGNVRSWINHNEHLSRRSWAGWNSGPVLSG